MAAEVYASDEAFTMTSGRVGSGAHSLPGPGFFWLPVKRRLSHYLLQ